MGHQAWRSGTHHIKRINPLLALPTVGCCTEASTMTLLDWVQVKHSALLYVYELPPGSHRA